VRIAAPPDRVSDEGVRRSLAGESRQEKTSDSVRWSDVTEGRDAQGDVIFDKWVAASVSCKTNDYSRARAL
jgi:hypothetical protein